MRRILFILILLCYTLTAESQEPIKVACIGNSITYGSGISSRDKNSYPAQLQTYLGEGYKVTNFGVSATTAITKGDYPYINTSEYKNSLEFNPDILLIKFGTNDSKSQNIRYFPDFKDDVTSIIQSYKQVNPEVRVVLLTPLKSNLKGSSINDSIMRAKIDPALRDIAFNNNYEIVNLTRLLGEHPDSSLMPDGIHPSSLGAGIIAKRLHLYLTAERAPQHESTKGHGKVNDFWGYKEYIAKDSAGEERIVEPKLAAKGYPWVLRARFWGHEPQTDIYLLEQGFHIMYCDVSDLYGAPIAVSKWDKFYSKMTKQGFSKKVVLEGMSRGGLIAYNWAYKNPRKVACIYADAPVLDIKSWPMGLYRSNPSASDIKNLEEIYQIDIAGLTALQNNPLDHAKQIGRAGYPILHVIGDADLVVPPAENTLPFAKVIQENKGDIKVINKPDIGHHPHSLYNPTPIAEFILEATNRYPDYYSLPIYGAEFRSGAGWAGNSDWHAVDKEINTVLEQNKVDILFLGNSITQGLSNKRNLVGHKPGLNSMKEFLPEQTWESAGISGDKIQNLIWRVKEGNYELSEPKFVVISIGVNNIIAGEDNIKQLVEAYKTLVNTTLDKFKESKIILLGLLPVGLDRDNPHRVIYNELQAKLAKVRWSRRVTYVNPTNWFVGSDGNMIPGLYGGDGIHLTPKGYDVWCKNIKPLL